MTAPRAPERDRRPRPGKRGPLPRQPRIDILRIVRGRHQCCVTPDSTDSATAISPMTAMATARIAAGQPRVAHAARPRRSARWTAVPFEVADHHDGRPSRISGAPMMRRPTDTREGRQQLGDGQPRGRPVRARCGSGQERPLVGEGKPGVRVDLVRRRLSTSLRACRLVRPRFHPGPGRGLPRLGGLGPPVVVLVDHAAQPVGPRLRRVRGRRHIDPATGSCATPRSNLAPSSVRCASSPARCCSCPSAPRKTTALITTPGTSPTAPGTSPT